jgi:hypothetical protein
MRSLRDVSSTRYLRGLNFPTTADGRLDQWQTYHLHKSRAVLLARGTKIHALPSGNPVASYAHAVKPHGLAGMMHRDNMRGEERENEIRVEEMIRSHTTSMLASANQLPMEGPHAP